MFYLKAFACFLYFLSISPAIVPNYAKPATEKDFNAATKKQPTIIAFSANWLSSNNRLESLFTKWASKYTTINFVIVDIDKFPRFMDDYNIAAIPTIIFKQAANNNKNLEKQEQRYSSLKPKQIEKDIKSFLKNNKKLAKS